jgi:hypothetical protein
MKGGLRWSPRIVEHNVVGILASGGSVETLFGRDGGVPPGDKLAQRQR